MMVVVDDEVVEVEVEVEVEVKVDMLLKVVGGGLDIKPYYVHVSSWALPWLEMTTSMG